MNQHATFAGLTFDRPRIMGVVNVTPDSFSDGGDFFDGDTAIAHGRALAGAGADILDVGGESTRPGAAEVSIDAEIDRVVPVIRALAGEGHLVSIDTRRGAVMQAAVAAGATLINDVSALTSEPDALATAAQSGAAVVLMHMLGEPRTMQEDPVYEDVLEEVYAYLEARVAACEAAGVERSRIAVDPGIGFGKNDDHNTHLLANLSRFHDLGVPIVLGVSRKSFIGRLSRGEVAKDRLGGSLAAALVGVDAGVQVLRVHDVAETRQALDVWMAIYGAAG